MRARGAISVLGMQVVRGVLRPHNVAALVSRATCFVLAGAVAGCGTLGFGASPSADHPLGRAPVAVSADAGGATCHAHDGLPDSACTPGAADPQVTQATITATICTRGWTATVRPIESVTEPIKRERMAAYGYTDSLAATELDHLIPLELGGASTVTNLWPQPWAGPVGATVKDDLENRLNELVCSRRLPLQAAQEAIARDWVAAYRAYIGPINLPWPWAVAAPKLPRLPQPGGGAA